jgi:hypothetical protein
VSPCENGLRPSDPELRSFEKAIPRDVDSVELWFLIKTFRASLAAIFNFKLNLWSGGFLAWASMTHQKPPEGCDDAQTNNAAYYAAYHAPRD